MTVTVSPNGKNHYESSTPTDEVLVATADGVVALGRSGPGAAWRETGRMLTGKHIASMVIEPAGTIFAGTHKSGLWASEDGGDTWERRDAGIASDNFYALTCVVAPDGLRLYAGTEPAHLYVSRDLGRSWAELPALRAVPSVNDWTFPGPPHVGHVKTIAFDPRDADTIYVGVEVGGAFKTTDGGRTWRELNDAGFYVDVHRLFISPDRPDDVYMATGRGLYHSPNAGASWELMSLPGVVAGGHHGNSEGISYPDALVIRPGQPDLIFTAGASASPGAWRQNQGAYARVGRSRDAGRNWEYLTDGLPVTVANIEALTMNAYLGGYQLFAGTTHGDVFYSEDEGGHWTAIARALPPVSKGGHYRGLRPDWTPALAS